MGKPKCLIIGAAPELYWDERFQPDLIICADGGLDHARDLGLKAHIYIGDSDSSRVPPDPDITVYHHNKEKAYSDLQACLEYVIQKEIPEVTMIGVTGGRLDHFWANACLLEALFLQGIRGTILDENNEIRLFEPPCIFTPPHPYRYFSILPLDEKVAGVIIEGSKYPLKNAVLRRCDTLGISNEPLPGQTVRITIGSGRALIIRSERMKIR